MATLPLAPAALANDDWYMRVSGGVRRVVNVVGEMNYAVRRATGWRLTRDLGSQCPETCAELLLRSSACLVHEPSASERAAGQRVG
jgi:hypothetical protein